MRLSPLIPADAGTQCFGFIHAAGIEALIRGALPWLSLDPGVRRDERVVRIYAKRAAGSPGGPLCAA
jgi:hypothetical protein